MRRRSVPILLTAALLLVVAAVWMVTRRGGIHEDMNRFLFLGRWDMAATVVGGAATYAGAWGIVLVWARRRRLWLGRCLLMSGAIVGVIGLLELPAYLRWVDYRHVIHLPEAVAHTQTKPWDNPVNRTDPDLLHLHQPHYQFAGQTPGDLVYLLGIPTARTYPVDVRYDHHGFRNERDLESADVVLIGDSFLEAGLVPYESTAGPVLERALGVAVANLGQGGYGTHQERLVLERFGLPLRPRVVVWYFFEGNDLRDVTRYLEVHGDWQRHRDANLRFLRRSLTSCVFQTLAFLTQPRATEVQGLARRRSARVDGERLYFAYPGQALDEGDLANLHIAEDQIRAARESCRSQDVAFLFVFVPTKFRVYAPRLDTEPDSEVRDWIQNDLPQRLEQFCAQQDIPFLDLTPVLDSAAAGGTAVYFADDGHWNETGCRLGNEAVAAFVQEHTGR